MKVVKCMRDKMAKGNAAEWLKDAESDLAIAGVRKTAKIRHAHFDFMRNRLLKSLKALFVALSVKHPRTHDLAFIIDALPEEITMPPFLLNLPILTKYAVQYRYPGQNLLITTKDLRQAIELAEQTVNWVKTIVEQ